MKSIDIKKPKYILPALVLPFILGIGWIIKDMWSNSVPIEETQLTEMTELNTEIPDAELEKRTVHNKFEALKSAFNKSSDFSSIRTIDKEENNNEIEDNGSLYTNEEMRHIDSLNQASQLKKTELDNQTAALMEIQNNALTGNEKRPEKERELPQKSKMQEEMELFKMQMAYIDSLQNPQRHQKPVVNDSKKTDMEEKTIEVMKAVNPATAYFNTVGKDKKTSLITAILDENVKVTQGSRIRIRLLDDIMLNDAILSKGTYIYGNVSGFSEQRVKINISSIMLDGKRMKVDLSVYDIDGQEGFFVPSSAFRDLSKDIGSQVGSQNITMNTSNGGVEQFAFNALQDAYRSTTQALSKNIKKNKAKLKYNTQIFLVNNKEEK